MDGGPERGVWLGGCGLGWDGEGWEGEGEGEGEGGGVPLLWVLIEKWDWWVGGCEPEVLRGVGCYGTGEIASAVDTRVIISDLRCGSSSFLTCHLEKQSIHLRGRR